MGLMGLIGFIGFIGLIGLIGFRIEKPQSSKLAIKPASLGLQVFVLRTL